MNRRAIPFASAVIGLLSFLSAAAHAAAAQASAEVLIQAPADRVWRILTEVDNWPRWNRAVDDARLNGPVSPGSVFVWKSQGFTVTSTLVAAQSPRHLVWTGEAFGTTARHAWEIITSEHGVTVRTWETFDGWLPQLMPGAMQRKLQATLPAWLDALRIEAERR